jgi:hypothetical protein
MVHPPLKASLGHTSAFFGNDFFEDSEGGVVFCTKTYLYTLPNGDYIRRNPPKAKNNPGAAFRSCPWTFLLSMLRLALPVTPKINNL